MMGTSFIVFQITFKLALGRYYVEIHIHIYIKSPYWHLS